MTNFIVLCGDVSAVKCHLLSFYILGRKCFSVVQRYPLYKGIVL